MTIKVNIVEVASELAEKDLTRFQNMSVQYGLENPFPNGIYVETEDETSYTDEAQTIFDELYDDYYDLLWNLKEE
jgi:hypothetical protein